MGWDGRQTDSLPRQPGMENCKILVFLFGISVIWLMDVAVLVSVKVFAAVQCSECSVPW